ncbi:MGDG synthase family glycosyltransferase [Fervidibacillus albus]|uniref:UDP-glucuronosyltransferase n=1 Tax=Fervidibacillus albus TaxID=2980026 RepID=A0A9E8LYE0_9BACI|nr:glycosyltransferase [Fervidibacillus albus]WAA11034.1 UDP-glucuronosyltransferase [Fervidibacillus albus]
MKNLLFLPFLQIPSGHHQAADAIMAEIIRFNQSFRCEKIDLFSYSYRNVERFSSRMYLKWIDTFPTTYSTLYKQLVVVSERKRDSFFYEIFFLRQMEKLIAEKKPDGIICTHALPSLLLSKLKMAGKLDIPVFNVYTDFFIHKGWGIEGIDGHFISTENMKSFLLKRGVKERNIFLTGIPTHPQIQKRPVIPENPRGRGNVCVSGGSMGAGKIIPLINQMEKDNSLHYYILCGKNSRLYRKLCAMNKSNIIPIGYIPSRKMMDLFYNQMDLLVTKPGGLTVTEALNKKIPVFIYYTLPGQEEFNLQELKSLRLVKDLSSPSNQQFLSEQLKEFLHTPTIYSEYFSVLDRYEKMKLQKSPAAIIADYMQ